MGCCALESGDAIAAIPVRKLISLRGSASPLQPRGAIVTKSKRRHAERDFTPTHPNAAAIDIGSRMHVAAVPPDRDTEPVRAFGTCTGDLQQLADWFERCGVRTVAMESTGVYWIPAYELLEQRGIEVVLVNARRRQAPAGTQDRRERRPMAETATRIWAAARQLQTQRRVGRIARLFAPT